MASNARLLCRDSRLRFGHDQREANCQGEVAFGRDTLSISRVAGKMAPAVGFEPTTNRLTADRSTTELLRKIAGK